MRRRPHKNKSKHQKALKRHVSCHRSPAHHRRKGARGATNYDVLGRYSFQPDRVDHNVEKNRESQQSCSKPIGCKAKHHDGKSRKCKAKAACLLQGHFACRDRPFTCPLHDRVDICVPPHVQSTRCTTANSNAQDRDESDKWMDRGRGRNQAHQPCKDHKTHDAGLKQFIKIPELCL